MDHFYTKAVKMMMDTEQLAEMFASEAYEIEGVYRLVIPPQSVLHGFKTERYGLLFPVRGQALMHLEGKEYDLRPGVIAHAVPGLKLQSRVVGTSEYEYFSVFYRWNPFTESRYPQEASHFKLEYGCNSRVNELLLLLHQHFRNPSGLGKLRVKELFLSLMHQVLTGCSHRFGEKQTGRSSIEAAVAYIEGHYMHPLTLNELAELHAMNAKSFSYYFHKYTGCRPIDYVIRCRLERACELLTTRSYSVRDVASSVGYANPFYFSRVFRSYYGMSPSSYAEHSNGSTAP